MKLDSSAILGFLLTLFDSFMKTCTLLLSLFLVDMHIIYYHIYVCLFTFSLDLILLVFHLMLQ